MLDLPINIKEDKGQIHIQKDLIAVQKIQVIPEHSVDSTHSNKTLKVEVEDKMESKLNQSSDTKPGENEKIVPVEKESCKCL